MALHLRSAGWSKHHLAGRGRLQPAAILLAAGSLAVLAGVAVLAGSLAPLVGIGGETSTMTGSIMAPMSAIASANPVGPSGSPASSTALGAGVITDGPVNGVAFTMTIPSIGYQATVLEGVESAVLDRGPGHYPDSAWPGHAGNVGVAAHNVYWLSFNRLKAGDRVEIQTQHGRYVYEIIGSKVVAPTDRTVLAQTAEHRLTLTTCYPLWAGAFATQRLVFFAREVGGVA